MAGSMQLHRLFTTQIDLEPLRESQFSYNKRRNTSSLIYNNLLLTEKKQVETNRQLNLPQCGLY